MFARNSFLGHPTVPTVAFEVHNIVTGEVVATEGCPGNAEEHAMFLNENSGWKHRIFKVVEVNA
jgi:hypothetical protein